MALETTTKPKPQLSDGDGDHDTFAHYVRNEELDLAILEGRPCTALCGKKWVPQKDHTKYPLCPTCKELYEKYPKGEE